MLTDDEMQQQLEALHFSETSFSRISQYINTSGVLEITDNQMIKNMVESTGKKKTLKRAAVLVALCSRNNEASVLFTVRSDKVGTHKGQVSFPGGHINDGESPTEAALRETYEEIGSQIGPIRILGLCQTVPAITGTLVTPVVGYLERDVGDMQHFSLNTGEVKSAFTRPIGKLLDPAYRNYAFGSVL
jgi:8-oxo-dGTP pyrophosphatase MutT (NUDIX family)